MTRRLITAACLWAALAAQAGVDVQIIQCTGALQRVDQPHVSIRCQGDLVLSTGSVVTTGNISLSATGSLTLQGVLIEGDQILLQADTMGWGSDTRIVSHGEVLLSAREPGMRPVVSAASGSIVSSAIGLTSSAGLILGGPVTWSETPSDSGATVTLSGAPEEPEGGGALSLPALLGLLLAAGLLRR